jgi:CDP-diacylglycerol--glycerol-3-phosphate 3-phosphatidyltransferase
MKHVKRIASRYLNWPNRISLMRLLLVPPFVILMTHQNDPGRQPLFRLLALGLFCLMAASDWLDGYLARHKGMVTRLGAFLDPIADKALIIAAVVPLSLPHSAVPGLELPDWVVVAIIGKDLWVVIGFIVVTLITGKAHVRPTLFGKMCTTVQLAMVAVVLASPELDRLAANLGRYAAMTLWGVVCTLSVLAVISYTRIGLVFIGHENQSPEQPKET